MIPILRVWSAECVLEKAPPAGTKRALESPVQSPAKRSAVASGARVFFFFLSSSMLDFDALACNFFLGGPLPTPVASVVASPAPTEKAISKKGPPFSAEGENGVDVLDDGRASRFIEEYGTELQVMAEVRGYFQVAYKVLFILLVKSIPPPIGVYLSENHRQRPLHHRP
jgi:hypothetical protein